MCCKTSKYVLGPEHQNDCSRLPTALMNFSSVLMLNNSIWELSLFCYSFYSDVKKVFTRLYAALWKLKYNVRQVSSNQELLIKCNSLTEVLLTCYVIHLFFSLIRRRYEELELNRPEHLLPLFHCPMSALFCSSEIWLFLDISTMKSSILKLQLSVDNLVLNDTLRFLSSYTVVY